MKGRKYVVYVMFHMVQFGFSIQNVGSPIYLVLLGVHSRDQLPIIYTILFVWCWIRCFNGGLGLVVCMVDFPAHLGLILVSGFKVSIETLVFDIKYVWSLVQPIWEYSLD